MSETRRAIKAQAKQTFKANYGVSIAITIVVGLISGALASAYVAPAIFVMLPISLGLICHFTMVYHGGTPVFSTAFTMGFSGNYWRKIGGLLWMGLWVFLWSLLFYIPGIIKAYEYSLTPYILANYPNVKAKEALNLSKRIMAGNKAERFVFDLSFIGWLLLGALTGGLLIILYVEPYMMTAEAGYCGEFIDRAVKNGVIAAEELNPEDF